MNREPITIGKLTIEHNHGFDVICDAVWHPYPLGKEHLNESGTNGYVTGKVVKGGSTSRLFHATSFTPLTPGADYQRPYCSLDRIYPNWTYPNGYDKDAVEDGKRISCVFC